MAGLIFKILLILWLSSGIPLALLVTFAEAAGGFEYISVWEKRLLTGFGTCFGVSAFILILMIITSAIFHNINILGG